MDNTIFFYLIKGLFKTTLVGIKKHIVCAKNYFELYNSAHYVVGYSTYFRKEIDSVLP